MARSAIPSTCNLCSSPVGECTCEGVVVYVSPLDVMAPGRFTQTLLPAGPSGGIERIDTKHLTIDPGHDQSDDAARTISVVVPEREMTTTAS